jgi:hypothetical protein
MSYASQTLSDELQKALAARTETAAANVAANKPQINLALSSYSMSTEVRNYIDTMARYREQAKQVRVGSY